NRAFLEDLAIAARQFSKLTRRHVRDPMKRAHEIRQIAKANLKSDIRDRPLFLRQQPCGPTKPRAQEVLMRRDTEHACKYAPQVARAEFGHAGRLTEIDRLIGVSVQPKCGLDRTAPVAPARLPIVLAALRNKIDKTRNKQQRSLVEADVSFALGCS